MNKFDELFQDHLPNIEKTSPLRQGEKEIYFHCFDNEIYYLSEILKYHNVPFAVYQNVVKSTDSLNQSWDVTSENN